MTTPAQAVLTNVLGNQSFGLDSLSWREHETPSLFSTIQGVFWIFVVVLYKQNLDFLLAFWIDFVVVTSKTQDGANGLCDSVGVGDTVGQVGDTILYVYDD